MKPKAKSQQLVLPCGAVAALLCSVLPVSASAQIVEEIVVTARKRVESLQDAPVSITALGAQELESRGTRSFSELLTTIPNVTAENGLQIRGIGYNTRNIGIEAGATVYVDGVYTGRPPTFNQDLTDVARVEVLRGPQGTLFGKNSIAGVVSITSNAPQLERSGQVMAELGNRDYRRIEGVINEPLGERAAFRGTFNTSRRDGYLKNLLTGQKYWGSESTSLRLSLLLQPTEDLSITLRGDNFEQDSAPRAFGETVLGVDPQTPPPRVVNAPGRLTTVEDTRTESTIDQRGVSVTVEYGGWENATLTSITGYRDNSSRLVEGEDDSAINAIEIDFNNSQEQFTQELRVGGTLGRFDYVAGLYYFNQTSDQSNRGILGTDFAIPPLGIPGGITKTMDPNAEIDTESYAAFVDLSFRLTDAIELLAGARFGYEKKDFDFRVTSQAPALFYVVPQGQDSFSDNDVSPTAGARYHFSSDVMGYVRYAKGYKSGGWNADFISTTPGRPAPSIRSLRFEPETAETTEVGLKSSLFDQKLVVNLAAFYTDFSNLQVAQFFGINVEQSGSQLAVTSNAGSATIKGAEAEINWIPVDRLQFLAGAGYQEAKYDTFENIDGRGTNANGKSMQGVPEWTGNASAIYTQPIASGSRLTLRADYFYIGSRFGDPLNDPLRENPSYWTANARITYAAPDDKWQVSLWGRNVTDREYVAAYGLQQFAVAQSSPVRTAIYGQPRAYGVELRARF